MGQYRDDDHREDAPHFMFHTVWIGLAPQKIEAPGIIFLASSHDIFCSPDLIRHFQKLTLKDQLLFAD